MENCGARRPVPAKGRGRAWEQPEEWGQNGTVRTPGPPQSVAEPPATWTTQVIASRHTFRKLPGCRLPFITSPAQQPYGSSVASSTFRATSLYAEAVTTHLVLFARGFFHRPNFSLPVRIAPNLSCPWPPVLPRVWPGFLIVSSKETAWATTTTLARLQNRLESTGTDHSQVGFIIIIISSPRRCAIAILLIDP